MLINAVTLAGFEDAVVAHKHNIFEDVPDPSSAMKFGTQGISLRALKPV